MNILIFNGSPKKENSDTLKMTNAFMDGFKSVKSDCTVTVINTISENVGYCLGCYSCWYKTPGRCVLKDNMKAILEQIQEADLIIWSAPLYCYSLPASLKAVQDRLLPFTTPVQYTDEKGDTHHPGRGSARAKHILISGCGFPQIKGNFDGLFFQFRRMFGADSPILACCEAPLFSIPEAEPLTAVRLELIRKAGNEYAKTGAIADDLQSAIQEPMLPPDEYRKGASAQS